MRSAEIPPLPGRQRTEMPISIVWTDSIPFSADALRTYISLVAMT
jgi:hypothetical protein